MTVLIVEDETLTRLMLIGELEAHGHTVVEAADADEALLVLRGDKSIKLLRQRGYIGRRLANGQNKKERPPRGRSRHAMNAIR